MREDVGRRVEDVSVVVRWVILVENTPVGRLRCVFTATMWAKKKVDYPMLRGGAVSVPALVTLRITEGREDMIGAPEARSQAL